jgi:tetratricopeptide (TPR) repeat protein
MTRVSFRFRGLRFGSPRRVSILVVAGLAISAGCTRNQGEFIESGKKYLAKQDYSRALLQFENAVKANPKNAEAYYQAGLAYLKLHNYGKAGAFFKKATELDPHHSDAQIQMAQLLAATGDKEMEAEAEQRARSVLATSPDNEAALNALALIELALGQQDDGQKQLEAALQKFPKNLTLAANLAGIKLRQGDTKGAVAILKKAAAEAPNSSKPSIALGRLYIRLHNFDEAERQFRRAVELDRNDSVTLMDLGGVQEIRQHPDQAEQTYQRVAALGGKYKHVHAAFLMGQGKVEEAVAEFEKIARQDRHDRAARSRLVAVYLNTGRVAAAQRILATALKQNPKDVDALYQRAESDIGTKEFEQAQRDIEAVLHMRPDSAESHRLLSVIFQARGKASRQKQELAEALKLRPAFLKARLELAQAHIAAAEFQAALELLNETPVMQRRDVDAIVRRNWALAGLGHFEELRKGIDAGLALARSADLLLQDGILRMQQKDYAGARSSLEEGLKTHPEDIRLLKALAGTYVEQKQQSKALEVIQAHVSQRPQSAPLQSFLGQWLLASHLPEQARVAFLNAKNADPRWIDADLALAQIEVSSGNIDAARKRLTGLLATNGESAKIRLVLGTLEETAKNPTAAIEHYRKALETNPRDFMVLNNLAGLLIDQGNTDEAVGLAQQALELAPNAAPVEDTLGWALFQKRMYKEAAQHLENSFAKQASPRTQYHLAMADVMAGYDQRGRQAYYAALKANPNLPEATLAARICLRF